ncbi:MAG: hypothetical protein Q9M94_00425 [Candidatus Gracilibacteria bacterium]|nr:hypothetical protein [Candidatus Gracilibacteria bacterium]
MNKKNDNKKDIIIKLLEFRGSIYFNSKKIISPDIKNTKNSINSKKFFIVILFI